MLQLGNYPTAEVLLVTFVTTLVSFPISYTRMDASSMIAQLFKECSPVEENNLCDYAEVVSCFYNNFIYCNSTKLSKKATKNF